jgi:hypothetical protein
MAIDRRVSADKPKMMDETKGFVAETEALQHVQKPDGLFGIMLCSAADGVDFKPVWAVGEKLKTSRGRSTK